MGDFGERLADRFLNAKESALMEADAAGAEIFDYASRLTRNLSETPNDSRMPDEEAAELILMAISRQAKWSPDEAKPQWDLALKILAEEPVVVSLFR